MFIDKCGYNIWSARSNGSAGLGERAYRQVCGQRGRNVTVALAISGNAGLVFHTAFHGGMNGEHFADFLTQTRSNLDPDEDVIFIFDGAPTHSNSPVPAYYSEVATIQPTLKHCRTSNQFP